MPCSKASHMSKDHKYTVSNDSQLNRLLNWNFFSGQRAAKEATGGTLLESLKRGWENIRNITTGVSAAIQKTEIMAT